ncbi:5'-AMP-activated protein kinase subunit beta-2 isoform X4 [Felis catus]|uniref:5'-AMP-activated protein kinase subunit beta-2 isoform X4 n=1 Tax=Felis catus TaxID=9685 RepID=UPI001D19D024|nr:5'-AMP-activated protein kinase subunit beta-2 isoform X4 [Felis catus]
MRRVRSTKSWWGVPTIPASSACRTPSHNDFVAILDLPEGEHQYKFFVDGQWVHDPSEPVVTSQLGTINNLIHVKKSDFEVFDALKLDSMESSETSCRDLSSSPPGPYGQEMYVFRSEERFKSPPILPPHLLQVILNKDTNISCDPALLPEPNHVMLNHLYALSIKIKKLRLREGHIASLPSPPVACPEAATQPGKEYLLLFILILTQVSVLITVVLLNLDPFILGSVRLFRLFGATGLNIFPKKILGSTLFRERDS